MKQKYQDKANPCYRDTDSFKVNIKTKHVCKAMATVLEKIELWTMNYWTMKLKDPNKQVKINNESDGEIMTELRTYD